MSFYLTIDKDKLHWGGKESITETYAYIPGSTAYTHIGNDGGAVGKLTSPMGTWVIGSSVKANYVASKLRMRGMWIDNELMLLAGENNVVIVVYTDDKVYIYRNSARTYESLDLIGSYVWSYRTNDFDIKRSIQGNNPPQWSNYSTEYVRL